VWGGESGGGGRGVVTMRRKGVQRDMGRGGEGRGEEVGGVGVGSEGGGAEK